MNFSADALFFVDVENCSDSFKQNLPWRRSLKLISSRSTLTTFLIEIWESWTETSLSEKYLMNNREFKIAAQLLSFQFPSNQIVIRAQEKSMVK